MKRPSFFISSTIYDFRDLRSALKYFLEQQGCTVLASEYNDFPKPLDTHTYDACLKALEAADYFILFIGSRVGGWYDKEKRVSITQQEYRAAYQRHLEGKLKIISFVRADVWRYREDRKELSGFLETLDIDPGAKQEIKNRSSKWASDANFICDFISEVCRNKETKEALGNPAKPMPTGNWIRVFDNFRDVADAIQTQAFSGIPIEHVTLRKLLLREILEILRISLVKFKENHVYSPDTSVELFHREHKLEVKGRDQQYTDVNTKRWDMLSTFGTHLLGIKYNTLILQRALESPAFLAFDLESADYKEHPVYEALYQLNEQIRLLSMANTSETMSVIFSHTPRQRSPGSTVVSIETMKLLPFLHLLDRWVNVIALSRAIALHLRGKPFEMPKLRPTSPIPGMNAELERERVSAADVDTYINECNK